MLLKRNIVLRPKMHEQVDSLWIVDKPVGSRVRGNKSHICQFIVPSKRLA